MQLPSPSPSPSSCAGVNDGHRSRPRTPQAVLQLPETSCCQSPAMHQLLQTSYSRRHVHASGSGYLEAYIHYNFYAPAHPLSRAHKTLHAGSGDGPRTLTSPTRCDESAYVNPCSVHVLESGSGARISNTSGTVPRRHHRVCDANRNQLEQRRRVCLLVRPRQSEKRPGLAGSEHLARAPEIAQLHHRTEIRHDLRGGLARCRRALHRKDTQRVTRRVTRTLVCI